VGLLAHAATHAQEPSLSGGYVAHGTGFVAEEQWTSASVRVSNPTDAPRTLLSVMSFDRETGVQFGREIWLPPRSKRRVTHPVRGPSRLPRDARSVEVTSLLVDPGGSELALSREPTLMPSFRARTVTAILRGRPNGGGGADASDLLAAMRASQGLTRRTSYLQNEAMPTTAAELESLHSMVIASEELDLTTLQTRALRGWLIRGGRLWLPLDHVDAELPAELLGDAWTPVRIDETALTRVDLRGLGKSRAIRSDTPWTLHRYTPGDAEVTHRVGDWPAAMRLRVGKGEVFVTTLSADAWIDAMSPEEIEAAENTTLRIKASPPLTDLAAAFYERDGSGAVRSSSTAKAETRGAMRGFAAEQIGYDVMSRGPVVALLTVLPVMLLGSALWLHRRRRLEAVGLVGVAMATALAGVVLVAGALHAGGVPRTISSLQQVYAETEPTIASAKTEFALYSPSRERTAIRGRGGVAWPEAEALRGGLARLIWSDADRWSWNGLNAPAKAILGFTHRRTLDTKSPTTATATFTTQGLAGRIEPGPFAGLEDLVLATPSGFLPLRLESDGRFTASADAPSRSGGYIRGATLSQSQQRRQRVYEQVLRSPASPERPTVFAFSRPVDLEVSLSNDAQRVGEALVSWPLQLAPPEPGLQVRVPAPLVRSQPIPKVRGLGVTGSLFNPMTGQWIASSTPATVAIRFTAPQAVLPFAVTGATLWLDLDAPGREVEILIVNDGSPHTLTTLRNPRGRTEIQLQAEDGFALNAAGEAVLAFRVKPQPVESPPSPWQLHEMALSLTGESRPAASPRVSASRSLGVQP
jgi:hypothetical protein